MSHFDFLTRPEDSDELAHWATSCGHFQSTTLVSLSRSSPFKTRDDSLQSLKISHKSRQFLSSLNPHPINFLSNALMHNRRNTMTNFVKYGPKFINQKFSSFSTLKYSRIHSIIIEQEGTTRIWIILDSQTLLVLVLCPHSFLG